MNIKIRSDILILLLVMAAFASIFGKLVSTERFTYDESDYMYAVSKGFVASYMDRPSLSILDFVRTGIRSGLHSGERLNLSEYIRQQDDITFYRHFHAPLYFYCVDLIQNVASPKEAIARWTSLLSLMLLAVIVYFGCLALSPQLGKVTGFLAVGFVLLSPTNLDTAGWVAPHSLYAAIAMATLFFIARLIKTGNLQLLYGALFCLGLAFLTIEYAPLLLVTLLAAVALNRKSLFPDWSRQELFRFSLKCAVIPLAVIGALWPAGLFKLSLAKNYAFFFYFATVRGQTYGVEPLSVVWWRRISSSPVEYLLLFTLSSYLLYLLFRRRELRYLAPFFTYAALMFLTTGRNRSGSSFYVSSLIPCLGFISAMAIGIAFEAQPKLRGSVAALILSALAVNNFYFYYQKAPHGPADERITKVVNVLQESGVREGRLLVPQLYRPTIHFYFQATDLSGYEPFSFTSEEPEAEVVRKLVGGNFDGVIYEGAGYERLRSLLEKNWSVRSVVRAESERPDRAVAYYGLGSPADKTGKPIGSTDIVDGFR